MPKAKKSSPNTLSQIDVYPTADLLPSSKLEAKVVDGSTIVITNIENPAIANINIIEFNDLIGLNINTNGEVSSLKIFSTIQEAKVQDSDKSTRKSNDFEYFSNNIEQLKHFRNDVLTQLWEFNRKKFKSGIKENDTTYEHPADLKIYEKKVLAVINPVAGNGSAMNVYEQSKELLESNGFVMEELVTESKDFAKEHLQRDKNIKSYYAILVFAGDGTIHE